MPWYKMVHLRMVGVLLILCFGFINGLSDRERLITDLFQEYVKEAQPQEENNEPTDVMLGIGLVKLVKHQGYELSIDGWKQLMWKDNRLVWNASDYGGLEHIVIPSSKVWIPDVILYNGDFDDKGSAHHDTAVWISNGGHIAYFPHGRMRVNCQENTDVTQFTCTLLFGSWANDNAAIRLRGKAKRVDTDILSPSSRLSLVTSDISSWWKKFKCCPNKYDVVKVRLTLRDIDDGHHSDDAHDYQHHHHHNRGRRYH